MKETYGYTSGLFKEYKEFKKMRKALSCCNTLNQQDPYYDELLKWLLPIGDYRCVPVARLWKECPPIRACVSNVIYYPNHFDETDYCEALFVNGNYTIIKASFDEIMKIVLCSGIRFESGRFRLICERYIQCLRLRLKSRGISKTITLWKGSEVPPNGEREYMAMKLAEYYKIIALSKAKRIRTKRIKPIEIKSQNLTFV